MTAAARPSFAGPAIALGFWRSSAMALSLGAVILTHRALTADAFALFNLLLFAIAAGSAAAAPINRAFWAADTKARFASATLGTAGIVAVAAMIGLAPFGLAAAVAGTAYAAARTIEKFGYGRLLAVGESSKAMMPVLLFAAVDLAVAAAMVALDGSSLAIRVAAPALAYTLILAVLARPLISELVPTRERLVAATRFARREMASSLGFRVIGLGLLATAASSGDRLLANLVAPGDAGFTADYLLALSYAIALQTLTAFLFDLVRVRVFSDGAWKASPRRTMALLVSGLCGLALLAVASRPLLVALGLFPSVVGLALWAGLVARSVAASLTFSLNVDHYQQGRMAPLAIANLVLVAGGTLAFLLLREGSGQHLSAIILLAVSATLIAVQGWLFGQRARA